MPWCTSTKVATLRGALAGEFPGSRRASFSWLGRSLSRLCKAFRPFGQWGLLITKGLAGAKGGMKESLGKFFVRCRCTSFSHFRLCQFCSSTCQFMPSDSVHAIRTSIKHWPSLAVVRRFTGSSNPTRVKLRWDESFLYVGAELQSRLWGVQWTLLSEKQHG